MFGPFSGTLDTDVAGGFAHFTDETHIVDSIVEAIVTAPLSIAKGGSWSTGFFFRVSESGSYVIKIDGLTGRWYHAISLKGDGGWNPLNGGSLSHWKIGAGAENHIRLLAQAGTGWLYLNNMYEAEFDLSGLTAEGLVALFAEAENGTTPTHYRDLVIAIPPDDVTEAVALLAAGDPLRAIRELNLPNDTRERFLERAFEGLPKGTYKEFWDCPNCGTESDVTERGKGQRLKCPLCSATSDKNPRTTIIGYEHIGHCPACKSLACGWTWTVNESDEVVVWCASRREYTSG